MDRAVVNGDLCRRFKTPRRRLNKTLMTMTLMHSERVMAVRMLHQALELVERISMQVTKLFQTPALTLRTMTVRKLYQAFTWRVRVVGA